MKRPILFLDIDGVLNSVQYAIKIKSLDGMDPVCVNHLENICLKTKCDIVISSTWRRLYSLYEIGCFLKAAGFSCIEPPIIGCTPIYKYNAMSRGYEVQQWLVENAIRAPRNVKYVCVDDDDDFLPYQPLVQTDTEVGLTKENADRCIELLS